MLPDPTHFPLKGCGYARVEIKPVIGLHDIETHYRERMMEGCVLDPF